MLEQAQALPNRHPERSNLTLFCPILPAGSYPIVAA